MSLFLALDQSTSATKAMLFTIDGEQLDRESREHAQHYPRPGWVEHDAEEIWQNTLAALTTLLARHRDRWNEIASLSITNQRETVVVFDRASGQPLHPAIVWQCRRGDPICVAHAAAGHGPLIHQRTGLKLDPYFSASKLEWLLRNKSDLRDKLHDGSAVIGTIDTYLIHRLTSGRVFATDSTNASRTLLFDITKLRWDEELCALWTVPMQALAEVRESGAEFGETTLNDLLPQPLPIRGVMGDSQASLFAQRCFEPGSAKVTFGTGSSLLLNIGSRPRFPTSGVLTALAWSRAGVPTYAFEGIVISSASTLTWLCDQLGLSSDVPALEQLARSVPDTGGVYLVPAFTGLGLPHWQPAARAAVVGLSSHSDRRHVARAGFESIAFQVRDALESMRVEANLPLVALHADGGPTVSEFLMQITADVAGVRLQTSAMPDCSAFGAVLCSQPDSAAGQLPPASAPTRHERVFLPNAQRTEAPHAYEGWQNAVSRVIS